MSRFPRFPLLFLLACLLSPSRGRGEDFPDEKGTIPIAAWDVVPHQILSAPFTAGVVAFHEESVSVRFTVHVAGGELEELARTVQAPTWNPRTKVWEYVYEVDPSRIPDGPFELRAVCTPGGKGNRIVALPPLPLYANAKGTLTPGRTVYADSAKGSDANPGTRERPLQSLAAAVQAVGDGGVIRLQPGEYSSHQLRGGRKRAHWTLITPADGVKRTEVQIGGGRPGTDKLLFRNVAFFGDVKEGKYSCILVGEQSSTVVWLDNCEIRNRHGRWSGYVTMFGNRYSAYITGGFCTEMQRAPGALLMRNYRIVKISEDVFTDSKVAINCVVDGVDAGDTGGHADFHQSYIRDKALFNHGIILYNCTGVNCKAQGFFGHNLKDSAFVNCLFVKTPNNPLLSQYSGKLDHVLFLHLTLPNQSWLWRGDLKSRNCHMINCLLPGMNISEREGADLSGITIDHNHFIDPKRAMGENTTLGKAMFADPPANNYHLLPGSPAGGTGRLLPTVPADCTGTAWNTARPSRGACGVQGK